MFGMEVRAHHTAAPQPPLVMGASADRVQSFHSRLVFHCLHGTAPQYLARELRCVANIDSRWRLHSASTSALNIPPNHRITVGDHAFSVAAPHVLNSLPPDITASPSLTSFKQRLKTQLFQCAFHCNVLLHNTGIFFPC